MGFKGQKLAPGVSIDKMTRSSSTTASLLEFGDDSLIFLSSLGSLRQEVEAFLPADIGK